MTQIYFYKLTADNGGAPCVQDGMLSLAICKPFIRTGARCGDLIFGFAADSLHEDNRLIYIARVTEKVLGGDYYVNPHFARRADCVYERHGDEFRWRAGALYHGPRHRGRDLGPHPSYPRAEVLLSDDFRYFGRDGTADYKSRYPVVGAAVQHLGRGHRVYHDEPLRLELRRLKRQTWSEVGRKVAGNPTSGPRRGASHSGGSCGVVGGSGGL
jgi:hypothetical protein